MLFKVSIVIPTFNSDHVLERCLKSIYMQDYPRDHLEIVIADAGSTDQTVQIAKKYTSNIYDNPLKTGEAGKSVGVKHASHDILAFIDSDNILPHSGWIKNMLQPFDDSTILASEPLYYSHRKKDHFITRYCALMGMNDPLCYFLGNYDRYNILTNRWTEIPVKSKKVKGYERVTFFSTQTPTIGANGFLIRRSVVDALKIGNYFNDIDILPMLIDQRGVQNVAIAKVQDGIVHLFCDRISLFIKKQRRRVQDYLFFSHKKKRVYGWSDQSRKGIIFFSVHCILIFPLFIQALKGFYQKRDIAWAFHPVACLLTFYIYAFEVIRNKLFKTISMYSREGWSQG